MEAPKTATLLINLLEKQYQSRSPGLFKQAVFSLSWRAKVGSFPAPDLETIISAGEPCGRWDWQSQAFRIDKKGEKQPQDFDEIAQRRAVLPLYGYIPASSIRGVVRAWALHKVDRGRVEYLLGKQSPDGTDISPGRVLFLDAWPIHPTQLSLDIVNPQTDFQVYHQPQGSTPQACNPQPLYTLGSGEKEIEFVVAIRGLPNPKKPANAIEAVKEVWDWVRQALAADGIGGRTASGYGSVQSCESAKIGAKRGLLRADYSFKEFDFALYTQGCYGVDSEDLSLRPSHWRGWLRSWMLRFLLGAMPKADAEKALAELLGTIGPPAKKGCVRLQLQRSQNWGQCSQENGFLSFYAWKGCLQIDAPTEVFDILMPVMQFASTLGGVGRGWRRPLHIFHMENGKPSSRGCLLRIAERLHTKPGKIKRQECQLPLELQPWQALYQDWLTAVRRRWLGKLTISSAANLDLAAEVFSPTTCAVFAVPGPEEEPVNLKHYEWNLDSEDAEFTRGKGVNLIYKSPYKRNIDLGGNAGNGSTGCSWVSIKRVGVPHAEANTDCQEIVCLFMGGKRIENRHVRSQFLNDLANIEGAVYLFGQAPSQV